MDFTAELKEALKTVCSQFRKHHLPFCLAGGWAVSILGIARTTLDIDILIILDGGIKKRALSILGDSFDLILSHEQEMEFKTITIWRNIIALKGKNEHIVLDLLRANNDYLKGVIERKVEIDFEGVVIPVISIEDLVLVKLASFRKQDQVDIENLIFSGTPIDWSYLEKTALRSQLDWSWLEHLKNSSPE